MAVYQISLEKQSIVLQKWVRVSPLYAVSLFPT